MTETMRAAVNRRFGGPEVVRVETVPRPTPAPGEVRIRVHASTVSIADHRTRSRDLPPGFWFALPLSIGVFRPRTRILGMDAAGVVEAVGEGVTRFMPGDEVIAMLGSRFGGHGEAVCTRADGAVARKPRNLGMDEAAALVFGGHTALAFLGLVELGPGSEVLVNGASGAVGTIAVQLAKSSGAAVTGVCSAGSADLVRSLGADRVIDRATTDFAREGRSYDVIVDCVGNAAFPRVEHALVPGGALLLVVGSLAAMLRSRGERRRTGKLVTMAGRQVTADDFGRLTTLAEAGTIRPVIDRRYPLDEVVEAHRYVDGGRKRGNVVLQLA